jgi:hypothetical protein
MNVLDLLLKVLHFHFVINRHCNRAVFLLDFSLYPHFLGFFLGFFTSILKSDQSLVVASGNANLTALARLLFFLHSSVTVSKHAMYESTGTVTQTCTFRSRKRTYIFTRPYYAVLGATLLPEHEIISRPN